MDLSHKELMGTIILLRSLRPGQHQQGDERPRGCQALKRLQAAPSPSQQQNIVKEKIPIFLTSLLIIDSDAWRGGSFGDSNGYDIVCGNGENNAQGRQ